MALINNVSPPEWFNRAAMVFIPKGEAVDVIESRAAEAAGLVKPPAVDLSAAITR